MSNEKHSSLRIAAGAAAVLAGAFVVFQFAVERGAVVDPVAWTVLAWTCIVIMLSALVVGGLAAIQFVWGEVRGGRTLVEYVAENGPGMAQVRVRNLGRPDTFVATATVLDVQEQVSNPRFLRSYNLGWMGHSCPRAELSCGSLDTLKVATSRTEVEIQNSPTGQPVLELMLWGWEDGSLQKKDWFRWHYGDSDAVIVTLAIEVFAQRSKRPSRRIFEVKNLPSGGVSILDKNSNKPGPLGPKAS